MKNGYRIFWTDFALEELEKTIEYLKENFSEKELKNLAESIEENLILISKNPNLYQVSEAKKDLRRIVILRYNSLYYRIKNDTIEIISFFSNRQNP
ncbi:MAG: type II toxin-antitoxin system RelE/ParE family toxin [Bacteroidota bacterium]|jgi:plasmid stabilization system protein ParE